MATHVHRAFHEISASFVYWNAPALDEAGSFYTGPPPFSELASVTVIRTIFETGSSPYDIGQSDVDALIELEYVT